MLGDLLGWDFAEGFAENGVENYEVRVVFLQVAESVAEAVDFAVGCVLALSCALWRGDEAWERDDFIFWVNCAFNVEDYVAFGFD